MKAMILASGVGSRLPSHVTKGLPKSLLKLNGKTILDIEMSHLIDCGIKEVVITTGYQAEKIEKHVLSNYTNVNITFVRNKKYDTTDYIYSMWLARDFSKEDILLLHGDMVFEKSILDKLIRSGFPNTVLVNSRIEAPEKDFKAEVVNDVVTRIGVGIQGENVYFCAPIYKFSAEGICKWMERIDLFMEEGKVACYAEDALNQIADEIQLRPVYYEDQFCMEIDNYEDLMEAAKYYKDYC